MKSNRFFKTEFKLLDLFCGSGGASMGYSYTNGFSEIVGVDINPQPNYPFEFIQADAMEMSLDFMSQFDLIHTSPPCQHYSTATPNPEDHPDMVEAVRDKLMETPALYVIENVPGAPLKEDSTLLCGTMFPTLRVIRHRKFETNFYVKQLPHLSPREHPLCHAHRRASPHYGKTDEWKNIATVAGGGSSIVASARNAMQINWMSNRKELAESVPPLYAAYIGNAAIQHLVKQ